VPVETVIDALNAEVASGRIRAFGASNWPVSRLAAANEYAGKNGLTGLALSSPHLSLAVPMEPLWSNCLHATEEDITWHTRSGLPIFAWSALGHGFFREESGPGNRSDERLVRCYHNPDNFERLSRARQLAAERGLTAAQIALAYVLNLAAPTVAVVGPQTAEETQSCVSAGEVELSRAELDWLSLRAGAR
jgi:aryl-alcohol dehydrogenase-like predicted oxidoreductase